ncbi:MAG: hypothetical protein HOQ34_08120 [Gemmatimonadaceae bacterium]|nr:hypothetical protein [Gemmatimonadaceae bacterium]
MHTTKITTVALALALAATAACGVKKKTTDVSPRLNFAPTCENALVTYNGRADVPSDYYEVAWIEATGNSVYTTDNKLAEEIRDGAAKVGASAVIVNPVDQDKTGVKVLGEAVGAKSATAHATALAIYEPREADRIRTTCGK